MGPFVRRDKPLVRRGPPRGAGSSRRVLKNVASAPKLGRRTQKYGQHLEDDDR